MSELLVFILIIGALVAILTLSTSGPHTAQSFKIF